MIEIIQALIEEVNTLREKVNVLAAREVDQRVSSGLPIYSGLTAGRVLFVGTSKELKDDSAFIWDNSNKRLGVGTSAPDLDVDIESASTSYTAIELTNTNGSTRRWGIASNSNSATFGPAKSFFIRDISGSATRLVITSGGFVGLGNFTPSYLLELPNTASTAGQGRANAWVTYSSKVWKDNIKPLDKRVLKPLVKALNAVQYDLNTEGGGRDIGLIAEDVLQIAPDLVTGDPSNPETLGLKLDRLPILLIPLVQGLMDAVDDQQEVITRLQQRNATLETQAATMAAQITTLERDKTTLQNRLTAIEARLTTIEAKTPKA